MRVVGFVALKDLFQGVHRRTHKILFRLEIEIPEQGYQRTTLMDRDSLEELLEFDEVRERVLGLPPSN